jgi:hypothetical protein
MDIRAAECWLWVPANRFAATDTISCPSFESVATPGSKNTLKELSGVRAALGDIPNTLALVTKMAVVPNRSGEIFDMAHTVMILKVKRVTTTFPQIAKGDFVGELLDACLN